MAANVGVTFTATLNCPGTPANPPVFTSMHDNKFGEIIAGSTGSPFLGTGAAYYALAPYYPVYAPTVQNLLIRWLNLGVTMPGGWTPTYGTPTVNATRFENCGTAVSGAGYPGPSLNGLTYCAVTTLYCNGPGYTGSGFTLSCGGDADSDGLADSWEIANFNGQLIFNGSADPDGDGWTNAEELTAATNPMQASVTLGEPLRACSRRTGLVISEIIHKPNTALPGLKGKQFVEIYNSEPWSLKLDGYKLEADLEAGGTVTHTFPTSSVIGPANCVVIEVAGIAEGDGSLRLFDNLGALLLQVDYANDPPWFRNHSVAGHSLVMHRPSYGENDPRAWTASDEVGGSPGRPERFTADPVRSIVINEFRADSSDFIELLNTSGQTVVITGCWLSDSDAALNAYVIPSTNGIIAAGQRVVFTSADLPFGLGAGGDSIFFTKPSGGIPLRIVDSSSLTSSAPILPLVASLMEPPGGCHSYPVQEPPTPRPGRHRRCSTKSCFIPWIFIRRVAIRIQALLKGTWNMWNSRGQPTPAWRVGSWTMALILLSQWERPSRPADLWLWRAIRPP